MGSDCVGSGSLLIFFTFHIWYDIEYILFPLISLLNVLYEGRSKLTQTGAIGSKLLDHSNEIYIAITHYLSSFNAENFTYSARTCMELRLVEDTHHRCPVAFSNVMSVLIFTQQPYLSCLPKLLDLRLKKLMHSLLVGLFQTFKSYTLNLSAL